MENLQTNPAQANVTVNADQVSTVRANVNKLEHLFYTDENLVAGFGTEIQEAVKKAVSLSRMKVIPNYGGDIRVMVVFENNYIQRRTESETTNEFIKNVLTVSLDRYEKDESGKPAKDEHGNVKVIADNMVNTGRKDANGNDIYIAKTIEVVKGWKQLRTVGITNEQPATIFYPFIFTVENPDNWSNILGAALTEFKSYADRLKRDGKPIKANGHTHCTMLIAGESVGTKLVRDKGIKTGLMNSDFRSFCKSIYSDLKEAIAIKTEATRKVNVNALFD